MQQAVLAAVEEVAGIDQGDILIFMPTERHIHETAKTLRGQPLPGDRSGRLPEILPLYARLSIREQQRVFQPGPKRRVVIATNVAESSLTVPRIRYVIDPGTARISRYSPRSKTQRLPIEPVSRASADQRKGRCGRIGPGICVRLFGEEDYLARDAYTVPEIQRTNLAAVILQTKALRLGPIERFPFLDPPKPEAVRDGYRTLVELGALDAKGELTEIGRQLSRLPVDPRFGRMILAAAEEGCLHEVLIIAAALGRAGPARAAAGEAGGGRRLPRRAGRRPVRFRRLSEALGLLSQAEIGTFAQSAPQGLPAELPVVQSNAGVARRPSRVDGAGQAGRPRTDLPSPFGRGVSGVEGIRASRTGAKPYPNPLPKKDQSAARLRRHCPRPTASSKAAPIAGNTTTYTAPSSRACSPAWPAARRRLRVQRGRRRQGPSSGPAPASSSRSPKWLVAAEVVETTRRYLRTCGQIDPRWIEPIAGHLVKRTYHGVHWAPAHASAMALERVTLFGLTIVAGRRIHYGPIDPAMSRHLMIEQGLVEGHIEPKPAFLVQNEELVEELERLQAKLRRRDLLVPDFSRYEFYDRRVPADVYDGATLTKWLETSPHALTMTKSDLLREGIGELRRGALPRHVERPAPGTAAGLPVRAGLAAGRRDAQRADRGLEPGRSRAAGLAGARHA